mgnify:CR=1 FL=1
MSLTDRERQIVALLRGTPTLTSDAIVAAIEAATEVD